MHSEVHEVETVDAFCAGILDEYNDLFEGDLSNLPVVYKMRFDPSVTPVVRPPRKVPLTIEERVKQELERMVKIGAIVPVSEPTEWVSQMVAAKKKDGSLRICTDPRDLNKALKRPHHPMRTVEDVASRCPMPQYSLPLTQGVVSGRLSWIVSHRCSPLSAPLLGGTGSCAYPLASLPLQKFSSV